MNKIKINLFGLIFLVIFLLSHNFSYSAELDEVYKLSGSYQVINKPGLRIYFPTRCFPVIGRIASSFAQIREQVGKAFGRWPNDAPVSIIISDFDDRDSGSADSTFDLITLSLFEETDSLSTRSYSLEQKFAIRLSQIMILRELGPSKRALKRRIGILTTPGWFLEGLAMHKAFPIDPVHKTQILQMAKSGKIYSIDELDTINDQGEFEKDRMRFQARHMIDFWTKKAGDKASLDFLHILGKHPTDFAVAFNKAFKMSFNNAVQDYKEYLKELSHQKKCSAYSEPEIKPLNNEGEYLQSFVKLNDGTKVYVSSRRYFQEVYDLYIEKNGKKTRPVLKNVHPRLLLDEKNQTVYIGRYYVTLQRKKKLVLWAVPFHGKPFLCIPEEGSYKPFAVKDGRLFFLNAGSGQVRVLSIDPKLGKHSTRIELLFPEGLIPLDIVINADKKFLVLTREKYDSLLVEYSVPETPESFSTKVLLRYPGVIRTIKHFDNRIWFSAEDELQTPQLFSLEESNLRFQQISKICGGVWDFYKSQDHFSVVTLKSSGFKLAEIPLTTTNDCSTETLVLSENSLQKVNNIPTQKTLLNQNAIEQNSEQQINPFNPEQQKTLSLHQDDSSSVLPAMGNTVFSLNSSDNNFCYIDPPFEECKRYIPEFKKSYYLPRINKDEEGPVFGVYSYMSDRLDRNRLIFSPTYGFRSGNFGFLVDWMKRVDLFQTGITIQDKAIQKSYLSNTYFEKSQTFDIHARYPFTLSSYVSFGLNLSSRKIAKYPDKGDAPSTGNDNSIYVRYDKRAIRTQPFHELFPRKGREIASYFRKGVELFNGEMSYDSFSLRWNEYIPIKDDLVFTIRAWAAEDKKKAAIKRPDDLSLGGSDFLRGFKSSVRYGDSLRACSFHLGSPLGFQIPTPKKWLNNEILVAEIFYERGDVHSRDRSFDFLEDCGIEFKAKSLLFRQIPFSFRIGTAWPVNSSERHSYWLVDFSSITGIVQ
ncbi:MAG: hypothetical protein HQM10_06470 [Candidatus Riflebacteria bacterium]|nr:hypothetical protein [Candidatus Riflebacteria bacterium]